MAWAPFERVTLTTSLSPEAIRQRLTGALATPSSGFGGFDTPAAALYGTVRADSFSAWKMIAYRNSFLPIADARWRVEGARTLVDVRLSMHPIVIAFMAVWITLPMLAGLALVANAIATARLSALVLAPFGFVAAGYALATVAFRWELKETISLVAESIDAKLVAPDGTLRDPADL